MDLSFFRTILSTLYRKKCSWMRSRCYIRIFFGMYIYRNNLILTIKYIIKLNKFFHLESFFLSNDSILFWNKCSWMWSRYCIWIFFAMYIHRNDSILTIKYVVKLSKFFPLGSFFRTILSTLFRKKYSWMWSIRMLHMNFFCHIPSFIEII